MVDSTAMRISFQPSAVIAGSFFPGLAKPVVIESDSLAEGERRDLEALVGDAKFFDLPDRISSSPAKQLRDAGEMTITIERADQRHTIVVLGRPDGPEWEALRRLVNFLEAKAREARSRHPKAD